jgi:hypothetical protein
MLKDELTFFGAIATQTSLHVSYSLFFTQQIGKMQEEQRQRAVTAFQEFLTTPLEARLERHQNASPQSAALALFHKVAADVPAYRAFLAEQGISHNSIQTLRISENCHLSLKITIISVTHWLICATRVNWQPVT